MIEKTQRLFRPASVFHQPHEFIIIHQYFNLQATCFLPPRGTTKTHTISLWLIRSRPEITRRAQGEWKLLGSVVYSKKWSQRWTSQQKWKGVLVYKVRYVFHHVDHSVDYSKDAFTKYCICEQHFFTKCLQARLCLFKKMKRDPLFCRFSCSTLTPQHSTFHLWGLSILKGHFGCYLL